MIYMIKVELCLSIHPRKFTYVCKFIVRTANVIYNDRIYSEYLIEKLPITMMKIY